MVPCATRGSAGCSVIGGPIVCAGGGAARSCIIVVVEDIGVRGSACRDRVSTSHLSAVADLENNEFTYISIPKYD